MSMYLGTACTTDLSLDGFWLIPDTSITSEKEIRNFCSSDVILLCERKYMCIYTCTVHVHVYACTQMYLYILYMIIIMWYQRLCNCRQYCFDLVRSHQCSTEHTHLWYHGLIYSERLWFSLNEIHQPQLL